MYLMLLIAFLTSTPTTIYEFKPLSIDGKVVDFSIYKGKKILIVNTASECGNTPQYAELEKLYESHKENLVVIGFPANNFGKQEPGSNSEISNFCSKNYAITFPMMSKVSVKGDDIDALFKWLISQPNPDKTGDIRWNFEKFLLDEKGILIHRYHDKLSPLDEKIINDIKNK